MEDREDNYLMMSGLQHFDFCRRQWALIHIEQQWVENHLTTEGRIVHENCHDSSFVEKRNNLIITRGMRVVSHKLKLTGNCDVVEFYGSDQGISINRYSGLWLPIPVEYKRGHSKQIDADRLQLCAQALALEEMLVCKIEYGYLYYKETNRREQVLFDSALRNKVVAMSAEMNNYYSKGWTPKAQYRSKCKSCSLVDVCLPKQQDKADVKSYIQGYLEGD